MRGVTVTTNREPKLLTTGRIAQVLGVPLHRVLHVLTTRPHIRPTARGGTLRLYDRAAVAMVRHELAAMEARRCRRREISDAL